MQKLRITAGFLIAGAAAYAQTPALTISGIVWNADGHPLAGAHVAIRSADAKEVQSVVSGDDGTFVLDHLKPGHYELTETKAGFVDSTATAIDLAAGQTQHIDLTLTPGLNPPQGGFWHRVTQNTERTLKRIF
jgi:hypothetical protein